MYTTILCKHFVKTLTHPVVNFIPGANPTPGPNGK